MEPRDLYHSVKLLRGLSPVAAAIADNTAQVSEILDSQGLSGASFAMLTGDLADANATFDVLVEKSQAANMANQVNADVADLIGVTVNPTTTGWFDFSFDNKIKTLGIRFPTTYRYWRVTVTPAGNSGNAPLAGLWIVSPQLHPVVPA